MKKYLILIFLLLISIFSFSKNKLTGHVFASDKSPIIGAQLSWENKPGGTVTDENGFFEIEGVPQKDHMLHINYIGYDETVVHIHSLDMSQEIYLKENTELNEVVVTKSVPGRISSRTDPLKSEKIGIKELGRAACCNLSESFETNPSVDVAYSDAVTGAKQIQMLGLSGNYVQLLTENFPNLRGAAKIYGLDYIPGPWMEGVQISKGAASVKNGYESISGQANVDYKKPTTADPLSLNLFLSDASRIEGNADAAIPINENLSTGLFLHYSNEKKEHDGNDDTFLDMPKKNQFNVMNRWHYQTDKFISQSGIKFVNDERVSGQTMHTIGDAHNNLDLYQIKNTTNRGEVFTKNGLILDPYKNESVALIVSGSYHDQKSRYADSKYNLYESNVYMSLMYEKDFSAMHKLSTGLSYNWDKYTQSLYLPRLNSGHQPDKESVGGGYAEYTLNLNKLTVLAGLRADYSSLYDWFITPRLHLKYDVSPAVQFRVSAGKGYRSVFVLPENSFLLASSRKINIADDLKQESAWNYGASGTFHIPINGEELILSAEWYYTDFSRQVIVDMDSDPHAVSFYNLDGRSSSNVFQVEASYPLFRGFSILGAYRWMDTKVNYNGKVMEKPLTSRYRALITASFETPMRIWQFDFTTQFNGGGRMPTPDQDRPLWDKNFKSFVVMNAQITKFFRNWSVYLGGENLTNFKQKNPIIGWEDPSGDNFDATMVYGPTLGRKFYVGFRYNINR